MRTYFGLKCNNWDSTVNNSCSQTRRSGRLSARDIAAYRDRYAAFWVDGNDSLPVKIGFFPDTRPGGNDLRAGATAKISKNQKASNRPASIHLLPELGHKAQSQT